MTTSSILPQTNRSVGGSSFDGLKCPLSNTLYSEPVLLVPCGHSFEYQEMVKRFKEKKVKICPTCLTPCEKMVENVSLKSISTSAISKLNKPDQRLIDEINKLFIKLDNTVDKLRIDSAIKSFVAGDISSAMDTITKVMLMSGNSGLYDPIYQLMDGHQESIKNQLNGNKPAETAAEKMSDAAATEAVAPSIPPEQPSTSQSKKRHLENAILPIAKRTRSSQTEETETGEGTSTSEENVEEDVITAAVVEQTVVDNMSLIRSIKEKGKRHKVIYEKINPSTVNTKDKKGNTPLHLVIMNCTKTTTIIKALFDNKADLNAQNARGETGLHLAVKLNKVAAILFLLELGASKTIVDKEGQMPKHYAKSPQVKQALN